MTTVGTFDSADVTIEVSEEGWALLGKLEIGLESSVAFTSGERVQLVLCAYDVETRRLGFLVPIDQAAALRARQLGIGA